MEERLYVSHPIEITYCKDFLLRRRVGRHQSALRKVESCGIDVETSESIHKSPAELVLALLNLATVPIFNCTGNLIMEIELECGGMEQQQ